MYFPQKRRRLTTPPASDTMRAPAAMSQQWIPASSSSYHNYNDDDDDDDDDDECNQNGRSNLQSRRQPRRCQALQVLELGLHGPCARSVQMKIPMDRNCARGVHYNGQKPK